MDLSLDHVLRITDNPLTAGSLGGERGREGGREREGESRKIITIKTYVYTCTP